ncbi:GGDEF domain-containing response regulator [Sulfidibacter corallicola]|uniref:diguanylate cyclase n=1 Tax=Sulfidibacter corallicola TaxID=2818388 RepID=A0A8A4TWP2_SULCO|nr:GGDEF domain-containing response regulator [Sulfidibacter corallicola]QTD53767.1 GGDEF domain-containing response regulator [Sulfidibacter corallicola]
MNFLYVGRNEERTSALRHALARNNISFERTSTPEHAFFKILNEEITALFLDLGEPDINGQEVLTSLESINKDLEVVLITEARDIDGYRPELLRSCFGYVTSDILAPHNLMVLTQLTDKITIKARLEKLKNTSIIDGLTQLYNHAYIQQQIDEEIKLLAPTGDPISLVIFDIDHFKNYNDTNGHPAGDRVLKKIAEILTSSVRKFDLTGRYGGEEFVIILPGTKLTTALSVTERFRKKVVGHKFEFGHLQPLGFVSASFGVATLDHKDISDRRTLINRADQALYKAKNYKRNCIWYYLHGDYNHYQPSLVV